MASLRGWLGVRPGEGRLVALAATTILCVVALNVVTIGTATALVLGAYPASVLPPLYAVGAGFSILVTLGISSAVGRVGRWAETAGALFVFGASLLVVRTVLGAKAEWAVLVLHPWGLVVSSLLVVQTFTLVNDSFDSGQARRLFPLVGAAGNLGAFVGGAGLFQLAGVVGTANLLLVAATLAVAAGLGAHGLLGGRSDPRAMTPTARLSGTIPASGWRQRLRELGGLLNDRLLGRLVLVALATGIASTVIRFGFEVELKQSYEPDQIAAFIGGFNVACNVGALLVQSLLERRLIRLTGFVGGLVSLPLVLGLGAVAWLFAAGIWVMAAVRAVENVARYSVARTADELVVVPLSSVLKRRTRLLLVGLVLPAATLLASLLIASVATLHPRALAVVTLVAGALGALAALTATGPYLERLRAALASHRLRVDPEGRLASLLDGRTRSLIEAGLGSASEDDVAFSLNVTAQAGLALERCRVEALYAHADPRLRGAAVAAAAACGGAEWAPALRELLDREADAKVGAAAIRVLARLDPDGAAESLSRWVEDPRAPLRLAALATVRGEAAVPVLVQALEDRAQAVAASESLLHCPSGAVVAALGPLVRQGTGGAAAAARVLGQLDAPTAAAELVAALSDTGGCQRHHLLRALGRQRGRGRDLRPHRPALERELLRELRRIATCRLLAEQPLPADPRANAVLQAECRFQRGFAQESLFSLLALSHDPAEVRRAQLNLSESDRRTRSLSLDLLRHVLPKRRAALILPYLEQVPLGELLERARADLELTCDLATDYKTILHEASEPWLRWLALALLGERPRTSEEEHIMPLLEEMYLLRRVELFSQLAPEQLLVIAEISEEIEVPAATVVFEQGDPGDAFYVVLRGKLTVRRGDQVLATLEARDCFGETALLDGGLRTATVRAETDCELSVISSQDFHDLLEIHPSIARGMLVILAQRLAAASKAEGSGT
ncbi:MAG: cyclic nucleotide-binding domain-containing protein [Polyangiaceae bacterium]|nr:cyclic nucleotide-binding domain-containing protein [Polyangiaceae bacterium]